MNSVKSLLPLLQCPDCRRAELRLEGTLGILRCLGCGASYPIVGGRPVLLRTDNEVFTQDQFLGKGPVSSAQSRGRWRRLIPSPSVNLSSERVLARMRTFLSQQPTPTVLVVGSGLQKRWLDTRLFASGADKSGTVVHTDIDVRADVDLFCDAHDLPFASSMFDAVVTTAVLEHVLYPERAAAEIHRVLKIGGVLYSELPFIQQVHEGAYDFTRYTLSGHRRLFNNFAELESGMVAGPGTALVWSLENFFLAFASRSAVRQILKAVTRLTFGWLKYVDQFIARRPEALDGASCTYYYGARAEVRVPDVAIIAGYSGAKNISHT